MGASTEFTLSIWALADEQSAGSRALISLRGGAPETQNRVELVASASDLQLTAFNAAGELVYQAVYLATLEAGAWHHLAVAFDGQVDAAPVLLVDGMTRAPTSANATGSAPTFSDSAGRIFVGSNGTAGTATWWGAVGQVAIWSIALGDDEISEIARSGHSLDLRENQGAYQAADTLLHYWRLGENPNAIGFDYGPATTPIDLGDAA